MSTGAKIAIGCGIAVLVCIIGAAVVVVGGAYWVKGKVDAVTAEQGRIDALQKKANATPFTRPADGIISEDRLVKFLEVRKRVYTVYTTHREELEALKNKKQAELSDVTKGFTLINEVRLAQAQAQADLGMSEDEYRFFIEQVYTSMWASEVAKSTGGKSVPEAAGETSEAPGKSAEETQEESGRVLENAQEMDVPPANIALFRKYEADIKQYAMNGLELLGL